MKNLYFIFFVIIFSLISLSSGYSQTYYEIVTQAYSCAYIDNDYYKAAELFEKAFEIEKAKSSELYYAAEVNLNIDSTKKFSYYLSQAINSGYANYKFLMNKNKFKTHFSKTEWDALLTKAKNNYSLFKKEYNILKDSSPNYYNPLKTIKGKIDLRNDSLSIKHQGKRNTCSVFAATALIEYLIWDKDSIFIDMSEAYNYWAAKNYTLTNTFLKEAYTSIDGLAGYLAVEAYRFGSMDENNWKYENTNWLTNKDERCKKVNEKYDMECFTGIPPDTSKKAIYTAQPVFIDREKIGQYMLQEKKPVVMNIFWYFDAIDNATGVFRLPTEEDIAKGGHVILLVGYNSESKTFTFQNSWGTKWGDKGFGTIPEEYIINYYELAEIFPYGMDASRDEKIEAIKGSMGVSAKLN